MTRPNPVKGGKGDKKSLSDFDPKEVEMGIRVELEHTKDRSVAEDIAIDHLTEDPHYYSKLRDAGLADELEEAVKKDLGLLRTLGTNPAVKEIMTRGLQGELEPKEMRKLYVDHVLAGIKKDIKALKTPIESPEGA